MDFQMAIDIEVYKQDKIKELENFLVPSYIVETRNGLHVYWLVKEGATREQFIECQQQLIQYFNADKKCSNVNRLLRVPDFYWCKDVNNKFLTRIIQRNEVKYDIQEVTNSLPEINTEDKGTNNKKKYNTLLSIVGTSILTDDNNIDAIKNRDILKLQEVIRPVSVAFNSHDEVYQYLKRQDLKKFLGLSGVNFQCIFHNDSNPSAGIVVNKNTRHQIYNCQSKSCGFKGTIIQVTERILNCTTPEALRFLRKVYKVDYYETEWQKLQKQIFEENQRFIYSNEFQEFYPSLYRLVRQYLHELSILNLEAKEHVITENFTDSEGSSVFFCGIRHLVHKYKKDAKTLCIRLGIFAYLGLVNKLNDSEIRECTDFCVIGLFPCKFGKAYNGSCLQGG
ncbi:DNA-primase RepB domain-containing protein [Desulfotomaculum defluvii]